jgi:hypothetical protein
MELECFSVVARPPEMVPGSPNRDWMDRFGTATRTAACR